MKLSLPRLTWPVWSRTSSGENFYDITEIKNWTGSLSNLEIAQLHPILTPAILFVAKIFSQAEFSVLRKSTQKEFENHHVIELLDNPNEYQTREDFLETLMFIMIAQGVAIVYKKKILGFSKPKSLTVLDKDKISWPENWDRNKFRTNNSKFKKESIVYDKDGENLSIKIEDLMFFYDLPNMLSRNPFEVKSRIDGLRQTLINTLDSLIAKNIILKSNGKEMITLKKEGFPLDNDEKRNIENLLNSKIGLSFTRKRGFVSKSDLTWKSLHIALRDLGLDESIKIDGNLIYTALHIPKDILSLEAKKTTYNNFKESMVSYIQNEMQASLNSFVAVFNKTEVESSYKLKGSYEHMPIMQFILMERYEVVKKQAIALNMLLKTGVPVKLSLSMCGMPSDTEIDLSMLQTIEDNGQQGQSNEQQPQTSENGEDDS